MNKKGTARTATLGLLLAFGLILGYVETVVAFPFGVQGMKLGLPNLAILLVLYLYGAREALLVNVCRVCLSAFLFGSLSSLLYSLAGALFSFLVMALLKKKPAFSVTGVSCAGGIAHNVAQLCVAVLITETVQIIEFLLLALKLLLQKTDLFSRLEIIIRNIQLHQNILTIRRLPCKTVKFAVFRQLIVDIGGYPLQIFLAFISAQR